MSDRWSRLFFNGGRLDLLLYGYAELNRQMDELKPLVRTTPVGRHRLEEPEFLAFQPGDPAALAAATILSARR